MVLQKGTQGNGAKSEQKWLPEKSPSTCVHSASHRIMRQEATAKHAFCQVVRDFAFYKNLKGPRSNPLLTSGPWQLSELCGKACRNDAYVPDHHDCSGNGDRFHTGFHNADPAGTQGTGYHQKV